MCRVSTVYHNSWFHRLTRAAGTGRCSFPDMKIPNLTIVVDFRQPDMVLARHPALSKNGGIRWRMPARFVLSAAGISALTAIVVFMMFLIQEQHSSAKAAATAVRSPVKTVTSTKTPSSPAQATRHPENTAPIAAPPRTAMEDFDLSRSRQWKTIGTLKLRVTRIDLRHGACDLSISQPGHRILNQHLFIGSHLTIPGDLGARATQIMITSVSKNGVSGYILAGTGENRESSETELGRRRQPGG